MAEAEENQVATASDKSELVAQDTSQPWRDPYSWYDWAIPRIIDGVQFSFDHLCEFDMALVKPARGLLPEFSVSIRVVFDCHVVTEKDLQANPAMVKDDPSYWFDSGNVCRAFRPDRYELSRGLPQLLRGLTTGETKCYVAKRSNYMVWEPQGAGAEGPHYQAFFDIYRTASPKPRLVMYVQSAYLKDEPLAVKRDDLKPFATICATLMGAVPKKAKGPRNKAR